MNQNGGGEDGRLDVASLSVIVDQGALIQKLNTIEGIRNELLDLLPVEFGIGVESHIVPSGKLAMVSDELRPRFAAEVFRLFDAACVNHLLQGLEVRFLGYKLIGE